MEPNIPKSNASSWTNIYVLLLITMGVALSLHFVPRWFGRPDLEFLANLSAPLVAALAAMSVLLRRLEEGTLTRGLLLTALVMFVVMGGLLAFSIHGDLIRLGQQLFGG